MFKNFWLRTFATRLCLVSILSLTCVDFARADLTWTGGGGDNNWSTGANWGPDSAPTANDTLDFAGIIRPSSVNDLADGTTFGDIDFLNSTNTNFSLSGNRITLGGNINVANNGSGTFTHSIANNLELSGSRQFYAQGDETLVLSGNITSTAGTQNFSKGGDGTLILQGTNNASDNGINQLQVWKGTVQFSNVENLGDSFIQGGLNTNTGTLEYVGAGSTTDLQIKVGDNTAGSGQTGGMNIESNGTGALVFDTEFKLNGRNVNATVARTLSLGGTNTDDNRVVQGIQDNNTAGGGIINLVKDGAGTWVLGNDDGSGDANIYTGTTTVNAGILRLSDEDKLYNNTQTDWNSTNVTVASGATLAFNMSTGDGSGSFANWTKANLVSAFDGIGTGFESGSSLGIHINSGVSQTFSNTDDAANPALNEVNAGTGFRKTGDGTLITAKNHKFTGVLNVDAGTLQLGTGFSNGMVGGGTARYFTSDAVVASGAKLKFFKNLDNEQVITSSISGAGTIEIDAKARISGDLSGFSGTTNITNGSLELGDNATSGSLGGDVIIASGAQLFVSRSDAYTFSGQISGDGSLIQEGDNAGEAQFSGEQLILSGNNSYTGGTTINSETEIVAASNSALGTGVVTLAGTNAGLILNDGITLVNNINLANDNALNHVELSSGGGSAILSGDIAVNNNDVLDLHFRTNGGNLTVAGNIADGAGDGFFNKDQDGTLTLTGNTTLTGGVRIDGGLSSVLQIGNGGTTGSVTSEIDNRGLVVFNRSNAYTHSGVISTTGLGTVRQSGSGTTTLTGVNSYLGETQVNAGTLVINGDQSAATGNVIVASGATLAGTGTIGGATTISGTHGPGNSAGIQTFNSDLSYEAGAVIDWELVSNASDSSGTRGTDFDGIDVGGALSFNGATTLNFDFSGSVNFADAFWTTDGASESWSIFTGATSVNSIENLSFNVNGATSPGTFTLSENGSDVVLNYSFSAVPEPTTFLMFGLGLGCLGFGRRRKAVKSVPSKA
ncbi:MAG: autotransporter-associated beta strand repeat-containing protein [Mariniblastus sp.]|nr:autotransporter-associated beta strand repeat-containing protein [Mariniblastus sp.]